MRKEGYDQWGREIPHFNEFWEFLQDLCDPKEACPGCRQDGGPPFCGIRKCARKKGVEVCVFCKEYPCSKIHELAEGYPTLIPDGLRMKEIGIDEWIREQKECAATGFVYADIRCYPYEVPEE